MFVCTCLCTLNGFYMEIHSEETMIRKYHSCAYLLEFKSLLSHLLEIEASLKLAVIPGHCFKCAEWIITVPGDDL